MNRDITLYDSMEFRRQIRQYLRVILTISVKNFAKKNLDKGLTERMIDADLHFKRQDKRNEQAVRLNTLCTLCKVIGIQLLIYHGTQPVAKVEFDDKDPDNIRIYIVPLVINGQATVNTQTLGQLVADESLLEIRTLGALVRHVNDKEQLQTLVMHFDNWPKVVRPPRGKMAVADSTPVLCGYLRGTSNFRAMLAQSVYYIRLGKNFKVEDMKQLPKLLLVRPDGYFMNLSPSKQYKLPYGYRLFRIKEGDGVVNGPVDNEELERLGFEVNPANRHCIVHLAYELSNIEVNQPLAHEYLQYMMCSSGYAPFRTTVLDLKMRGIVRLKRR